MSRLTRDTNSDHQNHYAGMPAKSIHLWRCRRVLQRTRPPTALLSSSTSPLIATKAQSARSRRSSVPPCPRIARLTLLNARRVDHPGSRCVPCSSPPRPLSSALNSSHLPRRRHSSTLSHPCRLPPPSNWPPPSSFLQAPVFHDLHVSKTSRPSASHPRRPQIASSPCDWVIMLSSHHHSSRVVHLLPLQNSPPKQCRHRERQAAPSRRSRCPLLPRWLRPASNVLHPRLRKLLLLLPLLQSDSQTPKVAQHPAPQLADRKTT